MTDTIIRIYKTGWSVMLRAMWYYILVALLSFPVRLVYLRIFNWRSSHPARTVLPLIAWVGFLTCIAPFVNYCVSRLTGEFIGPRVRRGKTTTPNQELKATGEPAP